VRDEFAQLARIYPANPPHRDPAFSGSPIVRYVEHTLRQAIEDAIGARADRYRLNASAGQGTWTLTPWAVILDRAVTTSVEEGFYVVYLLSADRKRLYLTLNQGCTTLKNEVGIASARETLQRRGEVMAKRTRQSAKALKSLKVNLEVPTRIWRGKLYEAGSVVGIEYDTANLPSESLMRSHLSEALDLYNVVKLAGGWELEDTLVADARADDAGETLEQAKRYKQHRAIERQSSHSKKVKKAQGTRCKVCEFELSEIYGERLLGAIEAHHLVPLAHLADGEVVRFDPKLDFAVLCPNCHRAIHRMPDPSDVEALRSVVRTGALARRKD
jgi:5-methylcytosine-specific restriction enzyme A